MNEGEHKCHVPFRHVWRGVDPFGFFGLFRVWLDELERPHSPRSR